MSRIVTAAVIVLLVCAWVPPVLHGKAGSLAVQGSRELLRSNYSAAVASFRDAVRFPKFGAEHRYGYAVALCQSGAVDDAVRELQSAPPDDKVANALGVCLLLQGDGPNGIRQFRKAIAERSSTAIYHHNLGVALARAGKAAAADAERRTARSLSKGASDRWSGLFFAPPWGMARTEALRCTLPLPPGQGALRTEMILRSAERVM